MMLRLAAMFVLMTIAAQAQKPLISETLVLRTESSEDLPIQMTLGFGGVYTDSIDYNLQENRERLLPGPPPATFYAFFINPVTNDWFLPDYRAVPDSVESGERAKFSLVYTIDLFRGRGNTFMVDVPDALTRGIDSIRISNVGSFKFFTQTLTGPGTATLPNGLTQIEVVVFYDMTTASVSEPLVTAEQTLRLYPNPTVAGREVVLRSSLSAGSRIAVSDLFGRTVLEERVGEQASEMRLSSRLAPGTYFVRAIGESGESLGVERLVVIQ